MSEISKNNIAIIGLAGRFPGAQDARGLWDSLCNGHEAIRLISDDELECSVDRNISTSLSYVKARAILDDVDQFDAELFRFLPREAELTDPQQRLMLESAWAAMEDAGYAPRQCQKRVGVFAGCSINTYLLAYLANDPKFTREFVESYQVGAFSALIGNGQDFLATRISYKLNLRGPAMTVQSACSTSLLAVAQACGALRAGQTDLAIAGGVSISFPQKRGYLYQPGGMVSPDGHCRPFDADASGTVFGAGVGAVVLKRASEAIADGDYIYALIKGVGVSNDGSEKVGYAAPSTEGQATAISMAYSDAGISPEMVGFVECHGTGTPLGDPIEVEALERVFRASTKKKQFCTIGSLKGNIGHLDVAAGVTGLIKAAFALEKEAIPGTKHFRQPNPKLKLDKSSFKITSETQPWLRSDRPRRAGVSAFGVGGTNVHLVLEEAPQRILGPSLRTSQLLIISALSEKAVIESVERLQATLHNQPELSFADTAFTLSTGREAFPFRAAIVANNITDFIARRPTVSVQKQKNEANAGDVAFVFPGQGSQYSGMGAGLYRSEREYRSTIDLCDELLAPKLGLHIRDFLLTSREENITEDRLRPTRLAQPALFITSYAAARMWMNWGIKPNAMLGHSLGELVAACLAGVMKLEDALTAVAARGSLMDTLPYGSMLAVNASLSQVDKYLQEDNGFDIAAENGPVSIVLSGPTNKIADLQDRMQKDNIPVQRLKTSHAFHSSMVDSIIPKLESIFADFELCAPEIAIASTITGKWLTSEQAVSPNYWAHHCRNRVEFSQALACLLTSEPVALLECGAGNTLSNLIRRQSPKGTLICSTLPSLQEAVTDDERVQNSLGELWKIGIPVSWEKFYAAEKRCRVPLPSYAFQRQHFWPQTIVVPRVSTDKSIKNYDSTTENTMTMISHQPTIEIANTRLPQFVEEVLLMLESLSGLQLNEGEEDNSFLELGLDSLFLTQLASDLQKKYSVAISFRQLLNELSSPKKIARYINEKLPVQKPVSPDLAAPDMKTPSQSTVVKAPISVPWEGAENSATQLMEQQISAMSELFRQQMQALGGLSGVDQITVGPARAVQSITPSTSSVNAEEVIELKTSPRVKQASATASLATLSEGQLKFVEDLIVRYSKRTVGSKNYTQKYRSVLADPRAVNGFRKEWKEMTYGLVVDRAKGSKLWDVDGNEYIDLVNGFGPTMFGHGPQFVIDAVKDQIEKCFAVGPQSPLAGDTAQLIAEITNSERVTFCNTGSEAVMAAMRLARTVTGRDKVVFFAGDYHGQFDEVLVRGLRRNGQPVSLPGAPGIPIESVGNIVVLEYGESIALEYLNKHANELAAVIVEPVQSRHPDLQPREFLKEVRRITESSGAALIFDEVVTGFRICAGGAQEYFDIQADMVTYGKVVGGGMPIGILAGKSRFMDALDGGTWQFGDTSSPEIGMTFFAGTFVRHPLVLAAIYATLKHIRDSGEQLYQTINRATEEFAEQANGLFAELGVPFTLEHCGSILYLAIPSDIRCSGLLFALLRERGVYAMEHFPLYMTTTHSSQDMEKVLLVLRESIEELQSVGLFPKDLPTAILDQNISPLTGPQMEILLAAQMGDEENCAFNESCTLHLDGPLELSHFESSWGELVGRHDALRVILAHATGMQKLNHSVSIPLLQMNLSHLDKATADKQLNDFLKTDAATAFNLHQGPLVRVRLVHLPDDKYHFIFTVHHIICDGWSINILMDELAALYSAKKENKNLQLSVPKSFLEYARNAHMESDIGIQETKTYWMKMFKELPMPLELPKSCMLTSERTFAGDTLILQWPTELTTRLRKSGGALGCTLFVTLLGVWQLLLMRLSSQQEVTVVIPAAAQSQLEEGTLVGHCVHLLPICIKKEKLQTVANYLDNLKQLVLDAYEHQELTFGSLIQLLKIPREIGRLPLSEVQFNLEKQGKNAEFSGLRSTWSANAKAFVNFDLFINIVDAPDGLRLECDFNSTLYSRQTIECWLGYYREMLEGVLRSQQTEVDDLFLLNAADQVHQLSLNNPTTPRIAPADTVIDHLHKRVVEEPNAIAVEFYGQKLSYSELFHRSSQLAKKLIARNITKGDLVGIYLERSIEMVIAMVGILQSGASYVPLDPVYPRERIVAICNETSMHLLLTSEEMAFITDGTPLELLMIDAEEEELDNELPLLAPQDVAYVIFTSGSTGKPKGVQITHGNLINTLAGVAEVIEFDKTARLLAVTTLSFDIAALELIMPLVCGATVVIAQRDDVADGSRLIRLLRVSRATVMQATPITWRMLVAADMPAMPHLSILCGGESWDRALADVLLSKSGTLWNMYGPTETTIWSAFQRVLDDGRPVGIQQSLPNQRLYILDSHQQLVPDGVSGELYIAGEGVGIGYYQRPELSLSCFVDDVFSTRSGSRMYRTGDKVRRRADGTIEFGGRFDDQIKLRGFRIEPGEIESALRSLQGVDQAFVVLRNDRSGSPRLIAYTTHEAGVQVDIGSMQEMLRATLPEYMIPAMIVPMTELPLTGNNKVDRKRLPEPDFAAATEGMVFIEPQTERQKQLAAIWRQVLALDKVSIDQPLLSLGADSLHIFQIAARAQQGGLPVTARQLMKLKTLEAICKALDETNAASPKTIASIPVTAGMQRASRDQYRLIRTEHMEHCESA